ncbi:hypothetical protein CANINC_002581 [Pichia inconspicua]|uniref:Uncharacterized protein n=1 Tax=Pichia inconspicua TaxID=52247 RepID=A0A4T0X0V5_9ASCO|nr:hypothetical protein CANINC_002581 [[Candida] inconspicua]
MIYELNNLIPEQVGSFCSNVRLTHSDVNYGFYAKNTIDLRLDSHHWTDSVSGQWTGNKMSLLGNLRGELFDDIGYMDGINKLFTWDKFLENYKKASKSGYNRSYSSAYEIQHCIYQKNMITPLYNLLCLYYLYEHEAALTYDPETHTFNNGIVSISNDQLFPGYKKVVNAAVTNVVEFKYMDRQICPFDEKNLTYGIDSDDVIINATSDYSDTEIMLLRIAFAEWVALTPHMLAHSREACIAPDQKIMIKSYRNFPQQGGTRINHIVISNFILKLVDDNHLHADFHIAYGIVCQIFMGPLPRTPESAAWLLKPMTVMLPRARFCLGADPELLLSDTPFYAKPYVARTIHEWRNAPALVILHSIIINESAYIQLAALQRVYLDTDFNIQNYVELSSNNIVRTDAGLLSDLCLVAMRYDVEIKFPYRTRAGLNRNQLVVHFKSVNVPVEIINSDALKYYDIIVDPEHLPEQQPSGLRPYTQEELDHLYKVGVERNVIEELVEIRKIKIAESQQIVLGAGNRGLLNVQYLPPTIFPVVTYGINPKMIFGLDFNMEVTVEPIEGYLRISDGEQFSKFFDISKMMGYNLVAYCVHSKRFYYNFIDDSSRYFHDSFNWKGPVSFSIKRYNMVDKRFECLPHLSMRKTRLTSTLKNANYCFFNGTQNVNGKQTPIPMRLAGSVVTFEGRNTQFAGSAVPGKYEISLQPLKLDSSVFKSQWNEADMPWNDY